MSSIIKNVSSLIIALVLLFGILFLPEVEFGWIYDLLNTLKNSNNTAVSFGYHLVQNLLTGAIILGISILLGVAAKRAYKNR